MARAERPAVQRTRKGFRINLDPEERDLIHRLLGELRALLTSPDNAADDRLVRLFPTAYHQVGDRAMDDEYQRLMRDELVTSRLLGLDVVADSLVASGSQAAELTEQQMTAFLQALNGVRLVLGTMLDVGEDHELDDVADDHPLVGEFHLYDFLSYVLDAAVRALQS